MATFMWPGIPLGDITVISGSVVVTTIASDSVSFKLGYNPVNENIYVAIIILTLPISN